MRDARRAGIQQATSAMTSNKSGTVRNVARSWGRTPYRKLLEDFATRALRQAETDGDVVSRMPWGREELLSTEQGRNV